MKLPFKFQQGFLAGFDQRTRILSHLHNTYIEILDDLGGEQNCSRIRTALVEKFVWLQFMMESIESRIALKIAQGKSPGKLFSRWMYAAKSLNSLAHRLGLEKRPRMIESSLSEYVGKKRRKNEEK